MPGITDLRRIKNYLAIMDADTSQSEGMKAYRRARSLLGTKDLDFYGILSSVPRLQPVGYKPHSTQESLELTAPAALPEPTPTAQTAGTELAKVAPLPPPKPTVNWWPIRVGYGGGHQEQGEEYWDYYARNTLAEIEIVRHYLDFEPHIPKLLSDYEDHIVKKHKCLTKSMNKTLSQVFWHATGGKNGGINPLKYDYGKLPGGYE